MVTKSVLIIGADRGIGLNLLKAFQGQSWDVSGTVRPQSRDDPSISDLQLTGATVLELDYLDESTVERAAAVYGDRPLDMLINVGGLTPSPKAWYEQTGNMMVEKLSGMAVGPLLAVKHFLPKLEQASDAKVVNILSEFVSISGNSFGTCMAYPDGQGCT